MDNKLKSNIINRIDKKLENIDEFTAMMVQNLIEIRASMEEVLFFKNFLNSLDKNENQ